MDQLVYYAQFLFGDATLFILLEAIVFAAFVVSAISDKRKTKTLARKLRPSDLVLAYSLMTAAMIQSISATPILINFKLSVTLTNLVALFYLCFFSPWFQTYIAFASTKMRKSTAANS